ncbi:hypothetical protein [Actinomadura sediminis]|uniref:Minor tail protein n=1 Tax=Actinomadura sediminis TaxID=1038904 RepID=A0ABW3ETV6_9ACTN
MAITFVGASSATASTGTLNISWPAGIQSGDLAVLAWNGDDSATWTNPAPLALLGSEVSGGTQESRVYYRVCDGINETGSLSLTQSTINKQTAIIVVYRGVHQSLPIDAWDSRAETVTGTTHANPSVTTVNANTAALAIIQERATDSSPNYTPPSGYTERANPTPVGGGGSTSAAIADDGLAVARAAGTTFAPPAWSNGISTDNVITWTITLRPLSEAHAGSATLSGALALGASGSPGVAGSAEFAGAATLTGAGSPAVSGGAAAFSGLLTLSARGTADTGIGLPPRPRTRWQLVLGPAEGGHELALTEASSRRYTARLNDNSDLSFSIDGRHAQADAIEELSTDVHLLFTRADGVTEELDRMRVGQTRDSINENEHRVEVTCLDYRAVLARRTLYSTDTLTYSATDQAEIAWGLIDTTQQQEAGALGISKAWSGTTPTGVNRDRTYEAGDSIGERIQELSETLSGFDWDITPTSASGLQLEVWHPERGTDRGVVLILGGLAAGISREVNPSAYANALRYTGAEGTTAVEREAAFLGEPGNFPAGRWDAVFGDDGLTLQATLDQRAAWQLAESQVIRPVYTVTLARGGWAGPDHIWVGDTVRLIVPSGRLAVDTTLRVHEVEIDLDGDGGEQVTLALGGPRPSFARWPSWVDKRLKNLERR